MCVDPRWVLSQTSVPPSSWLSCQGSADNAETPAAIGLSTVSIARIGSIVLAQFWEIMRFLAQFWDERNYEILGRSAGETECLAVDCCSRLRQPQHRLSSTYLPSHFWQVLVASSTFNISCVPSCTWWPAPWTETKWLICSQGNSATSADRLLSPTSMWFVSHLLHNLQHCIMIEISTDKNCFHVWRTKVWPLL